MGICESTVQRCAIDGEDNFPSGDAEPESPSTSPRPAFVIKPKAKATASSKAPQPQAPPQAQAPPEAQVQAAPSRILFQTPVEAAVACMGTQGPQSPTSQDEMKDHLEDIDMAGMDMGDMDHDEIMAEADRSILDYVARMEEESSFEDLDEIVARSIDGQDAASTEEHQPADGARTERRAKLVQMANRRREVSLTKGAGEIITIENAAPAVEVS